MLKCAIDMNYEKNLNLYVVECYTCWKMWNFYDLWRMCNWYDYWNMLNVTSMMKYLLDYITVSVACARHEQNTKMWYSIFCMCKTWIENWDIIQYLLHVQDMDRKQRRDTVSVAYARHQQKAEMWYIIVSIYYMFEWTWHQLQQVNSSITSHSYQLHIFHKS